MMSKFKITQKWAKNFKDKNHNEKHMGVRDKMKTK